MTNDYDMAPVSQAFARLRATVTNLDQDCRALLESIKAKRDEGELCKTLRENFDSFEFTIAAMQSSMTVIASQIQSECNRIDVHLMEDHHTKSDDSELAEEEIH